VFVAEVIIDLGAAVICFLSSCHPVLVGEQTPVGTFALQHYSIEEPEFGGDLLVFKETQTSLFAIHRVVDVPGQQRLERIKSADPKKRVVTAGCVNVEPVVYDELISCCSTSTVIIK
jgi:hypothetical protein